MRSALSVYPSQAPCLCIYPPVSPPPWSLPDDASPALAPLPGPADSEPAPPRSVHPLMLYCTFWFLAGRILFSSTHCLQTTATFAIPVSPTTAHHRLSAQGILRARLSVREVSYEEKVWKVQSETQEIWGPRPSLEKGAVISQSWSRRKWNLSLSLHLPLGLPLCGSGQGCLGVTFCCCHFLELDPQFGPLLEKGSWVSPYAAGSRHLSSD